MSVAGRRRYELERQVSNPSDEQIAELFSNLDETGHTNADKAREQHRRRARGEASVDYDPLSGEDPSGSDITRVLNRAATVFVLVALALVLLFQLSCSVMRRTSTSSLSDDVDVRTVTSAMRLGVEWGDGYTTFPQDFTVQEADESTGRVEVSVRNSSTSDMLDMFSKSQVQASALSINALLNPNINVVVYHVNAYVDSDGSIQTPRMFGLIQPSGEVKTFLTFIWTKTTTERGVQFSCTITGVDSDMAEELRDRVSGPTVFAPSTDEAEGEDADSADVADGASDAAAAADDDAAGAAVAGASANE